jgi:hypothetical protein
MRSWTLAISGTRLASSLLLRAAPPPVVEGVDAVLDHPLRRWRSSRSTRTRAFADLAPSGCAP